MIATQQALIDRHVEIRSERLMSHVRVLAGDAMRGRMPGDVGYRMAMDYVTTFLRANGIRPGLPTGGYEQAFSMETCRVTAADVRLDPERRVGRTLELGVDYVCRGLTGDGSVRGPLAFVGYCSSEPDFDELSGIDLTGKIAISFKHPEPWRQGRPVLPRIKAHILRDRGAIGLVIVPNPNRNEPDRLSASLVEEGDYIPGFPMIVVSDAVGTSLLDFDGVTTLSGRQYAIDVHRQVMSCDVPAMMSIRIESHHDDNGCSWNAVGYLPGADPAVADETVIIGAHLDHVGIQGESVIFNGAQDNASGVAAVLEIARTFASGRRPRRTIRFVLFGAEEAGLVGSIHYARNAPHPLEKTVAMLNLDCMGAGSGGDFRGRVAYPELFALLDRMNEQYVKVPDTNTDHPPGGADAKPFNDVGIPNIYFVSSDAYRHLHMASDTPETVNPVLFEQITRLAYLTAAGIAD
ncbi:M20/M25/M40 family metallo-hydrolase [bacterium]|nr:M20/M25/M40 family metallo-hydrolase [candidate division CSSED10-310 bacterium]